MNWQEPPTTETRQPTGLARAGTVLFLLLTALVLVYYLAIWFDPHNPLNPFPPMRIIVDMPDQPGAVATRAAVSTPTPSPTFPPTWTPTPTPTWTPTRTPRPTSTPVPPTRTPTPLPPFSLRSDPIHTQQLLYPDASGWWSGLAGEVSDGNGKPVTNVKIKVWDDAGHVWQVTPGDASRYVEKYGTAFGGGGTFAWWEQVLEASCRQSIPVHVQVLRNDVPMTSVVTVQTSGDCNKNLILIHFKSNY
ncbi:MAG: hypothetical protein JXM73_14300 [Anaerolineae bacterium]|nr:hypothetical protein [Anaerolineae bacterium]